MPTPPSLADFQVELEMRKTGDQIPAAAFCIVRVMVIQLTDWGMLGKGVDAFRFFFKLL